MTTFISTGSFEILHQVREIFFIDNASKLLFVACTCTFALACMRRRRLLILFFKKQPKFCLLSLSVLEILSTFHKWYDIQISTSANWLTNRDLYIWYAYVCVPAYVCISVAWYLHVISLRSSVHVRILLSSWRFYAWSQAIQFIWKSKCILCFYYFYFALTICGKFLIWAFWHFSHSGHVIVYFSVFWRFYIFYLLHYIRRSCYCVVWLMRIMCNES